jgi:hypothetical protein
MTMVRAAHAASAAAVAVAFFVSTGASSPASAQAAPRQYEATEINAHCKRAYGNDPFCDVVLGMVRSRYGSKVTMMQWNSQVGVYRHKRRQGKV